jgi:hypothetical protein
MGEIQNPRHGRFAQELAAANPADAAYEAAGYRKHRGNAARLSANEHVKERVKEIQAIGAERAAVTVQSLIEEAASRASCGPARACWRSPRMSASVPVRCSGLI